MDRILYHIGKILLYINRVQPYIDRVLSCIKNVQYELGMITCKIVAPKRRIKRMVSNYKETILFFERFKSRRTFSGAGGVK